MADVTLKQIKEVIQEELKPINLKLDEHSTKLDSLTLDMIDVQKKTDILVDVQSLIEESNQKVNNHEDRIQVLENAT